MNGNNTDYSYSITGLTNINADSVDSTLYNNVSGDLLQYLNNCRSNIQTQIDDVVSSGITSTSDLTVNSLTATNNISTPTIILNGSNLSTTLNGKQPLITIGTELTATSLSCTGIIASNNISAYNFIQRGSNLDDLLLTKQQNITSVVDITAKNITCNSLTTSNINFGGSTLTTILNNKLNNIVIGDVTTLAPATSAYVTADISGNVCSLSFGIPQGLSGANGTNGSLQ